MTQLFINNRGSTQKYGVNSTLNQNMNPYFPQFDVGHSHRGVHCRERRGGNMVRWGGGLLCRQHHAALGTQGDDGSSTAPLQQLSAAPARLLYARHRPTHQELCLGRECVGSTRGKVRCQVREQTHGLLYIMVSHRTYCTINCTISHYLIQYWL